jgi:translocation and assembly module TamB
LGVTRKAYFRIALLAALSFMLGFSYNYHLPKLESFLLVEIERVTADKAPVRVFAKKLHFHLLPLGVVLEDVNILAKPPLNKYLAPAHLKEAGARLAILPLIRGEVRLSQIFIRDSEINIFLKQDLFQGKGGRPAKFDFDQIYRLPVDEILLERVQIQGRLDPQNVVFRIAELNLLVENRYQSLFVETEADRVLVKPSGPVDPLNVQFELRALVESQEAQISAFKLKANDSFVVASGHFNGDLAAGRLENGAFDARAKMDLHDLNTWEKIFFLNPRLPELAGRSDVDLGLELRQGRGYKVALDLGTRDVRIDKFIVGRVAGRFSSDLKSVAADRVDFENSSGKAHISKLKLEIEPKPSIAGHVELDGLELRQFLENITVKGVPLTLPLKGAADCGGPLREPFEIKCAGSITSSRLHVYNDHGKKSTIVEANDLRAKGDVKITKNEVAYKGELNVGKNSHSTSDGVINYETGFKINYDADALDFADVKNLVNLKFEGRGKLAGSTTGTSKWATINMNIDGKDFWLEDYPLGALTTRMNYKAGHLLFDQAQGQFGVSRYNGAVDLNLKDDRIRLDLQIPFADLKDIQAAFSRKVQLPFTTQGTGTGNVHAEGPFAFRLMSYQMHSSFYRGEVANESFDEFVFNVKSTDGNVQSERIHLTKSSGVAELKGKINPQGEIDAVVVGRGLRLEQSENVVNLGFDLQGLADITMLIRGQLPKPRIELNGRLSRVVLADHPTDDSVFKLNFLSDRLEGSGQFLGSTILSDFVFPYDDHAPFSLNVKTRKWDFTTLFSLVSKSARQLDFATSLTSEIALKAEKGGFWKSTGKVQVDEFMLRKGGKQMANNKPMLITMNDGVMNSNNFGIASGESYLKLDLVDTTREKVNASVNGKMDLALLGLFTPFISDLRGNMAVSMDFKGTAMKPVMSGSAYVERGYVKFADFTHPFSNIRADVLFNDNQILVNTLNADLGGGRLDGEGKIIFNGATRPIDIKGTFDKVKMNVPEGYHTRGSGKVAIRGDNFPYTMQIDYAITGGDILAEFTPGDSEASVKASAYLPKFSSQEVFHPFTFAADVEIKKPITVNNSLIQAQINGHVKAEGTPDRLNLNGTLTPVAGGRVFFKDAPFDITSGYVEYEDMPPENPKIYVTATTHQTETVTDEQNRSTNQQYDISLLAQGRAQNPQFTLTSQPALSQREIVSLLALGVTSGGADRSSGTSAGNTGSAIGAALLQKAGGRKLKDTFGVEMKVSSSRPVANDSSKPMVTLSKQITPKFGVSASSTLTAIPANEVKAEYKLKKNISAIGSWAVREPNPQFAVPQTSVIGLDLEYKVNFK